MENLNVGEYIRLDDGTIGIVKYINAQNIGIITKNGEIEVSSGVVSSSPNIIDLIEEGDYVNGALAYEILNNEIETLDGKIKVKRIHVTTGFLLYEKDIKSIVTKEQFNQVKYEV